MHDIYNHLHVNHSKQEKEPQWLLSIGITAVIITITLLFTCRCAFKIWRMKRRGSYPQNTLVLHRVMRGKLAPSVNPNELKLETWLRMARIPYTIEFCFDCPLDKEIPWISLNNDDIADAQCCIDYLTKKYEVNLNEHLTPELKSIARAFMKLAEESLKWQMYLRRYIYHRDTEDNCIPKLFLYYYSGGVKKAAWLQGIGRHSETEVYQIGKEDLRAINDYIGEEKAYLTGDKTCDADATLFAILCQFVYHDKGPHFKFIKNECPNIIRYVKKIKQEYWKDWQDWIIEDEVEPM